MEVHVEFRHKSFFFLNKENQNSGGYTCLVKNIIITNPIDVKIKIVGGHQENAENKSVVGISIRNQTHIQKFPRGFGKIFPNLKYFEIDNSSITNLFKEDFFDLGHLQGLWMPRNPIVALPNDLFMTVQGLRYISFHKNKLKYIGHDILKPLKNLERANFLENTTIDKAFNNGGEEDLAALNREIATKCVVPKPTTKGLTSDADNRVNELEKRVQFLEVKINKMEMEKNMQAAQLTQVSGLSQMVEILQNRVADLENLLA